MITDQMKAAAVARLRRQEDPASIAASLKIPEKVVKEWQKALNPRDLVAIESNIYAVEELSKVQELVPMQEEILKQALEQAAIDLAKEASYPATTADVIHAKAINLCADAVCKLYSTLVLKGSSSISITDNRALSAFEALVRD